MIIVTIWHYLSIFETLEVRFSLHIYYTIGVPKSCKVKITTIGSNSIVDILNCSYLIIVM